MSATARALLRRLALVACAAPTFATVVHADVLQVGATRALTTLAAAARVAQSGDVVEVDAGAYVDDAAVWTQDRLSIRAVGGKARMVARDAAAEAKAIFVVRGGDVEIEGFEFAGAHVPDRNGAGIRHERGRLAVRDCLFEDNEMGLLTSNDADAELVVERSEFRGNRVADTHAPGDRIGHQLYVGAIRRFTLRESFLHDGAFGHLVKSRARESVIEYNRIVDGVGGRASYELELPDGGVAWVVGNVIAQSATTANPTLVSYGAESWRWPVNALYLVHNTLVDGLPRGGEVLHVPAGATRVDVLNNLVVGNALTRPAAPGRFAGNVVAEARDLAAPANGDYRLRARSRIVGRAADPGSAQGRSLRPAREYVHPLRSRAVTPARYSPGALQDTAP